MSLATGTLVCERRELARATAAPEIRAAEGAAPTFYGHAAVFDVRTAIGNPLNWGFYEEVDRGAFTKTLQEGDARFLVDHDSAKVVSRVSAGTLRLSTDNVGLVADSDLNVAKSYVSDLVENVRDGSVTGMSFGFYVVRDEWTTEVVELNDGNTAEVEVRRLLEVRLLEVSSVTFPAYEETDGVLRAIGGDGAELRAVANALVRRGDLAALEKRAAYRPELLDFRTAIREPGETTRGESDDDAAGQQPVDAVRLLGMRAESLGAFYGLPR